MRTTLAIALLVAGLAAGCNGGGNNEAATTGSPPPSTSTAGTPPAPLPPETFEAEAAPFEVVLTWELPPEEVERFELFRDGFALAAQPGSSTSYTDEDVVPGRIYNYEISSQTGDLVSGRLHRSVETPVPPLRAARLDGTFDIRTRFRSKSGYGDYSRPTFGWRFVPRCDKGPCNVVWRDIHETRFRARLERRGARYAGTYTGPFTVACEGSRATSVVDLDLRVVAAQVITGEWVATRVRGTIDQTESAQLGCGSSHAVMTFRGRRSG